MEKATGRNDQDKLGCCCRQKNKMRIWIIARDLEGKVLTSLCSTKPYIFDLSIADAVAAWKVVQFNRDLGFPKYFDRGRCAENSFSFAERMELLE
jgi:hypothetical protein